MSLSEEPQEIALTPQWIVLSKPAGWLTIPGSPGSPESEEGEPDRVLSEWARKTYSSVWVVHRLDRETSGVVLLARTAEAHREANSWFQNRETKKTYHCLASGISRVPLLKITQPVKGAAAVTQIEVKEIFSSVFLAQVLPRSGRRHQIRIHLAQAGHPLLGDPLYGGPTELQLGDSKFTIPRVALHASRLEIPTGEVFESKLPADFTSWLEQLRKAKSS